MIRRSSKILLEVIGVAVAVTATLLAVLAWQLSSGPVSLSLLNQMIEDGEIRHARLTELLGHTPIEVVAGSFLGIAVTSMLYWTFFKWPVF